MFADVQFDPFSLWTTSALRLSAFVPVRYNPALRVGKAVGNGWPNSSTNSAHAQSQRPQRQGAILMAAGSIST